MGSRRKFELMSPGALTDEGVLRCTEYSAEEYSTVDSITDDEGVEYSADNAHHALLLTKSGNTLWGED